jgi:plastocyanin domain-containing protein
VRNALRVVMSALVIFGAVAPAAASAEEVAPREVEIVVEKGYHPSQITAKAGERLRLKFIRREYNSCTREVVFPSLNIRRELPPNQPVVIDLPPLQAGELVFHCGMKMVRGTIQVEPLS